MKWARTVLDLDCKEAGVKAKEMAALLLLLVGWSGMLVSVAFYLLFWRVDNEPGAKDIPQLLWAAIFFLSTGGLAFLAANIYLLMRRAWKAYLIAAGGALLILLVALCLSPALLIFLV